MGSFVDEARGCPGQDGGGKLQGLFGCLREVVGDGEEAIGRAGVLDVKELTGDVGEELDAGDA